MGFGELNDNMIKGLTLYLRYHEQGFILYIIYTLTHMKKNQIKEKLIVESQAYCERKKETCIHEILSNDLYSWLGTFEIQIMKALLQGFLG